MEEASPLFIQPDTLMHGADYNPEQWNMDDAILREDFSRMHEAGLTSVSVGIFSWTQYEPLEGQYRFDWMDRLMDRIAEAGMVAFLATPSGSKPMWLSEKYPEIRRVDPRGQREPSGLRHNHCPSSTLYQEKVAILNERLAVRYKNHPALALWHISNELQGECFCESCLRRFHTWLEQRYRSLSVLNEAWWAGFWNHSFTDWAQIDPRDKSIDGLQVDWRRFVNQLHVEFLESEIAPLRTHTPTIPVSTNFMCFHPELDYWRWSQVIDIISNDSYPSYDGSPDMWRSAARTALTHDLMRGLASGKPWIQMECSPSSINWKPINKLKPNGVHLAECAQAIAHGADAVHYFQFRKGRGGCEKFHGAIIDHDSREDTRVFREVVEVGKWLKGHGHLVGSKCPRAEVVILHDWESQWALNSSEGVRQPSERCRDGMEAPDAYHELLQQHHRGWWKHSIATDILWPNADDFTEQLRGRKVVIAATLYMLEKTTARILMEYVRRGGCLILSHHSGVVDASNRVIRNGLPGHSLHEAAGAKVEEIDALFDGESLFFETSGLLQDLANEYQITQAYGLLKLNGAECIASPSCGHWKGYPIASHHHCDAGEVFLLAGNFCDRFHHDFSNWLAERHAIGTALHQSLPTGVHASIREHAEQTHCILINYTDKVHRIQSIPKIEKLTDVEGNQTEELELPPFAVKVIPLKNSTKCKRPPKGEVANERSQVNCLTP